MSNYKDEIYLLIILFLVILASFAPAINAEINSKEECRKEGSITMCREVYTRVTTDWHVKGEYKPKEADK
jgi:hypothetical protein